jgi:hypothetical protein
MLKFDIDNYKKEIELFIDYMNESLTNAWNEEEKGNNEPIEKLYNSSINISFNGATLELCVAPCEFDSIIECLNYIKEESENY